ncbi:AAA family ATPase [Helicobacter sp. T3_23-1059]
MAKKSDTHQANIITVANQKGGSGKSTIAINLAVKLLEFSSKVLVMDTDPQKSIETFTNIRESESNVSKNLKYFTLSNRTGNIAESLKQFLELYEYIIIDTGGIDSQESRKAMLYADSIILPTTPSQLDVDVLQTMLQTLTEIKDINDEVKILILMNKISTNVFLGKDLLEYKKTIEKIQKNLGVKDGFYLLGSVLKDRIAYKRAISEGLGISEYSDAKAKAEFEEVFAEFVKIGDLPTLKSSNSKKKK